MELKRKEFYVVRKQGCRVEGEVADNFVVDLRNKVNARAEIFSNNYAIETEHVLVTETMQIRQGAEEGHCKAGVNFQDCDIPKGVRGSIKSHGMEFAKEDKLNNIDVFGTTYSEQQFSSRWNTDDKRNRLQHQGREEPLTAPRICWERILPQRCLKVLLVEDDDSTRQVVSALLHHCGYEVTAVANGLQAWDLLEDESNDFNLVLTEVVMPCLSGIGLLSKIMSHQKCKNIPVIMMSSHDSIAIVFKCLTKGAVDFLVKPVRKNELKNIWKHVWKRCQNSSGSGSGSGSGSDCHSQKPAMLKSATDSAHNIGSNEESDNGGSVRQTRETLRLKNAIGSGNNTGSNEKNDNGGRHLNIRDGSDNGSGTQVQSFSTKQAEVEICQQGDNSKLGQNHGSTCAQITEPKKEKHQNNCKLFGISKEWQDKRTDYAMGLDLEIAVPREAASDLQCSQERQAVFGKACAMEEDAPSSNSGDGGQGYRALIASIGNECEMPYTEAVDLIGSIARKTGGRNAEMNVPGSRTEILDKRPNSSSGKDKTVSDSNFLPLLELSLKRQHPNSNEDGELKNRCVLRQSYASAFSRYNTKCSRVSHPLAGSVSANVYSPPTDSRHLCMPSDAQGTAHTRSPCLVIPFERADSGKKCGGDVSTPAPLQRQFCHGSNYQDMSSVVGSSGQDNFPIPGPMNDDMASASCVAPHMELSMSRPLQVMPYDSVPPAYGAAFHTMSYSQLNTPSRNSAKANLIERGDQYESSTLPEKNIMSPRTQQHSHHHNHHYHHHIQHHDHHHKSREYKQLHQNSEQDEQTMNNSVTMKVPQTSDMINCTLEGTHVESRSNGNGHASVNKLSSEVNDQINGKIDHYNHHHHHHVHHHHHHHQSQEYKYKHQHSKQDEQIMDSSALTGLQYGTCNNGQSGCSNGYGNVSRSDHGSDNGIIGQNGHSNGQSSTVIILGKNGESGSVNGIGASGGGVDQNRFTQREAALTKFRQKRSERCFEKKVRYQSRKRLAEQRPRVRGQFVRQVVCESTTAEAD